MAMHFPYQVLVVDDDPDICELLSDMLKRHPKSKDLTVALCTQGIEAQEKIKKEPISIVLTDINMPGVDGYALAKTCAAQSRTILVLAMTGTRNKNMSETLYNNGAFLLLDKPITELNLHAALDICLAQLNWWRKVLLAPG